MDKKFRIRDLPKEKRMQYIWDYYWVHILVVIAVVVAGGIIIRSSLNYREPLLEVIMINTYKSGEEQEEVLQKFLEENGYEFYSNAVSVDTNIRFGVGDEANAVSTNQLMCTTAAGEGDVYFWTGEEFNPYIERGALADLRRYFPQSFLNAVKDKLLYTTLDDSVEPYPCGISLVGNSWAREHGYINGGYVGISSGIGNEEISIRFIESLFNHT